MATNEDRHVIVELTEAQYSALLDIFRRAKVTVDEAPLAAEVLDALVRGARVGHVAQDDTSLGQWHPLSDLKNVLRGDSGNGGGPTAGSPDPGQFQTMGAHNA